jgi:hypothetical protein
VVTRSGTKPNFLWSSFSGAEAPNLLTPIIAQVVRGQVFEFMGILPLRHLLRTTLTPLDRVAPQIFAFWFEAPLINFFEPETWLGSYHFAFDRKSKLWKIFEWRWKYSETFKDWAKINHGAQAYNLAIGIGDRHSEPAGHDYPGASERGSSTIQFPRRRARST